MRNFIIATLLTAALSCLLQLFLPWWIVAPVAFIVAALVKQSGGMAFLAGFTGVFLLWVGYAFMLSSANDNILVPKVAELLKMLTQGSTILLFALTGLIGGLVAGFAALSGSLAASLKD